MADWPQAGGATRKKTPWLSSLSPGALGVTRALDALARGPAPLAAACGVGGPAALAYSSRVGVSPFFPPSLSTEPVSYPCDSLARPVLLARIMLLLPNSEF